MIILNPKPLFGKSLHCYGASAGERLGRDLCDWDDLGEHSWLFKPGYLGGASSFPVVVPVVGCIVIAVFQFEKVFVAMVAMVVTL